MHARLRDYHCLAAWHDRALTSTAIHVPFPHTRLRNRPACRCKDCWMAIPLRRSASRKACGCCSTSCALPLKRQPTPRGATNMSSLPTPTSCSSSLSCRRSWRPSRKSAWLLRCWLLVMLCTCMLHRLPFACWACSRLPRRDASSLQHAYNVDCYQHYIPATVFMAILLFLVIALPATTRTTTTPLSQPARIARCIPNLCHHHFADVTAMLPCAARAAGTRLPMAPAPCRARHAPLLCPDGPAWTPKSCAASFTRGRAS